MNFVDENSREEKVTSFTATKWYVCERNVELIVVELASHLEYKLLW